MSAQAVSSGLLPVHHAGALGLPLHPPMSLLSEHDLDALADAAEGISDRLEERRRRALAAGDDEELARIHEEYRRIAQVAHVAQRHARFRQRPLPLLLAVVAGVVVVLVLLAVWAF